MSKDTAYNAHGRLTYRQQTHCNCLASKQDVVAINAPTATTTGKIAMQCNVKGIVRK